MVFTRFFRKQRNLRALKRSLGQDISIDTGRGCINGTLVTIRRGDKLVLHLRNVRMDGDDPVSPKRQRD